MEKKKINILTRHNIVNYGSFFQTLATQKFFTDLGYDVKVIDYVSKNETIFGNVIINSKKRKQLIKKIFYIICKIPDEFIKNLFFKNNTKKKIKLTKRYNSLYGLPNYIFDDYLCIGSDQVWGYMPNGKLDLSYFGDFYLGKKIFSYSSSFGRDSYRNEEYKKIGELLGKFNFITVRERKSVEFIKEQFGLESYFIFDPTLMIDSDFWHNYAKDTTDKNFILVYQLRKNKQLEEFVDSYSKKYGLKVIRISTSIYDFINFSNKKVLKSPEKLLGYFNNAKVVITDSFHASVFSIIFNKNFIVFSPGETSMRITSLLNTLEINNAYYSENKDFSNFFIDYKIVNEKLCELRNEQKKYIKELLIRLGEGND